MIRTRRHGLASRQRGVTLIVALIMLTALGLLGAFAIKSGTANLRIVNNTQARQEAMATAQAAIEMTLSSPAFALNPAAVAAVPVDVDVDGDGVTDLSATLAPAPNCYRRRMVRMNELDPAVAGDRSCMVGSRTSSGGLSICAESEWNLRAVVEDARTGARMTVNQGVAQRGIATDPKTNCP